MMIYLVWDGYEDVDAAFLKEESASAYVEEQLPKIKNERLRGIQAAVTTSNLLK